jgi:hypothetical protein
VKIVPFDLDDHFDAVHRIWVEVGWVDAGNDRHRDAMRDFVGAGNGSVALIDDDAEAFGNWVGGTFWYVDRPVQMCAVTSITTSRIARKMGLATSLTARALREGTEAGHTVAALGIFDQGFYERFGFGTGSYEHRFAIDPATLDVDVPYRRPVRLSVDDWEEIHRVLTGRYRAHGSATLDPPGIVKAELQWLEQPFGLGYRDDDGRLTHFITGSAKGENGPYRIQWWGYETPQQLLELLRLLKELGDQVASVTMWEPPGVQLQDFIERPFRQRTLTGKSDHESSHRSAAFWQMRILDLEAAVSARRWAGEELRFVLRLSDPISSIEPAIAIDGDYVVTVGDASGVEKGSAADLAVVEASVNAFTRMWMGVRPASTLTVSDALDAPPEMLRLLDEAFALPEPRHGWFF